MSTINKANFIPDVFFEKILRLIPIACVDLLVYNEHGDVLLVHRKNSPAKGEWWFPGGRVLHNEKRTDAALRKLFEECGLHGEIEKEIGTYDIFFESENSIIGTHSITTVFKIKVKGNNRAKIDHQSNDCAWKSTQNWLKIAKSEFVQLILMETIN